MSAASVVQPQAVPDPVYRRKYVWQTPVRIAHWATVAAILVLFFTGLYIANPVLAPSGEAYRNFVMGRVRQIHFAAAYVFFTAFLLRIYCFWFGNNYARSGFPFVWRREWWMDLSNQSAEYLRLKHGPIHLGHNALGGLAYTVFVIFLGWAQILTGFALYSENNPGGFWSHAAGWVITLAGGSFMVHMYHHLFAWLFIVFAILHVYIVVYDSYEYKNGLITAMVSGYKFYDEKDLDANRWLS